VFAGPSTYEALARDTPFAPATFRVVDRLSGPSPRIDSLGVDQLVDLHRRWLDYVTGRVGDPPITGPVVVFTRQEYAHMADVRRVFIAFQLAAGVAAVVAIALFIRAAKRGRESAVTLARDAAIAAGLGAAAIALIAAVAFDPLFLLFHEMFFPQGNFLFGPDSNLIAMYPDPYWYGVTLRVGVAFVFLMAIIAVAAAATLRQGRR
jgi:hypothetical protein